MRGDVSIIDGKLCYAFDISDAWLSKLSEKSRFYKGKDEWKIKSVVDGVAWCYQVNPFNSGKVEIEKLSRRLDKVEGWMNEIIREQNSRHLDEIEWQGMERKWKIKELINRVSRFVLKKDLFKIPWSVGYVLSRQPTSRLMWKR